MSEQTKPGFYLKLTYGTPITGEWCNECQKSSLVKWPLYVFSDTMLNNGVGSIGYVFNCQECSSMGQL